MTLGPVHLTVADLQRSLAFYTDVLGLRILAHENTSAEAGVDRAVVRLTQEAGASARPRRSTGLYHFAILLPTRRDLGRAIRRLVDAGYPIQGGADHGVSEAIYLSDPDGNGIEIYTDRPETQWPRQDGALAMITEALDVAGILAEADGTQDGGSLPAGTRVGHVHLHVAHLDAAVAFYTGGLGLDLMQYYPPGRAGAPPSAAFLSAGGYHHHVGVNTWAGVGAPPPPPHAVGLRHFTIILPDEEAVKELASRLEGQGVALRRADGGLHLSDPSGNGIRVEAH